MRLTFKYTNALVNYLIRIEKYKTALDYLFLPTREKQKLMYEAKLKKTHFLQVLKVMCYRIIKLKK